MPTGLWTALGLATILVLLTVPAPAAALGYPCPGGPQADEVQVGTTGGGGGIAETPVCAKRAANGPAAPPLIYNRFASIAWHPDADDVWMTGDYFGGGGGAEKEAKTACEQAMGGGCTSIGIWNNSSMSIIRDRHGTLWSAWNGNGGAARKKTLADCTAKQLLPCEVIASFAANKRGHRPNTNAARKLYAVGAWVLGAEGYDSRLYIASGHKSWAAAEAAAIAACAKATARTCGTAAFAANGFIQTFELGSGEHSATPETSAKRAKAAAELQCKRQKKKCALQAAYDSRVPGIFVHDFIASKRP